MTEQTGRAFGVPRDRWSAEANDASRLLTELMSREEARTASAVIEAALPHVRAFSVDPRGGLLVLDWDRATVEMFVGGLSILAATDSPVAERVVKTCAPGSRAQTLPSTISATN